MPYGRYYSRRRSYSPRAKKPTFSNEVSNTDTIVRAAFFSLTEAKLAVLFRQYENTHGKQARAYAQRTVEKWKSGQLEMSDMISKRLFALVPPLMSVDEKYQIVEAIWRKQRVHTRRTTKYVHIGPDADPEAVLKNVRDYFKSVEIGHQTPTHLASAFSWLSADDVKVKQDLMDYFLVQQRDSAMKSAELNLELLLSSMKPGNDIPIERYRHIVTVDDNDVEMIASPRRTGFRFSNYRQDDIVPPPPEPSKTNWASTFFFCSVTILVLFAFCARH